MGSLLQIRSTALSRCLVIWRSAPSGREALLGRALTADCCKGGWEVRNFLVSRSRKQSSWPLRSQKKGSTYFFGFPAKGRGPACTGWICWYRLRAAFCLLLFVWVIVICGSTRHGVISRCYLPSAMQPITLWACSRLAILPFRLPVPVPLSWRNDQEKSHLLSYACLTRHTTSWLYSSDI